MNGAEIPGPGLYRIWWDEGGSSLAAVGVTSDGKRWLAPINWVAPQSPADWSRVLRADRIEVGDGPDSPAGWVDHIRRARDLLSTVLKVEEGE